MGTFVLLKFRFKKEGTIEKIPMSLGINFIVLMYLHKYNFPSLIENEIIHQGI